MMVRSKDVSALTAADFEEFPVWEFTNTDEDRGETIVRPVENMPVDSMGGRLIGTKVRLANGSQAWALLGNMDLLNLRLNQHFLTISIWRSGRWFLMARYHDFDVAQRGPEELARFLELDVDDVFPIFYDISRICSGQPSVTIGSVLKEPGERLSGADLIALAVRNVKLASKKSNGP